MMVDDAIAGLRRPLSFAVVALGCSPILAPACAVGKTDLMVVAVQGAPRGLVPHACLPYSIVVELRHHALCPQVEECTLEKKSMTL
jgi:hypothetical protein